MEYHRNTGKYQRGAGFHVLACVLLSGRVDGEGWGAKAGLQHWILSIHFRRRYVYRRI